MFDSSALREYVANAHVGRRSLARLAAGSAVMVLVWLAGTVLVLLGAATLLGRYGIGGGGIGDLVATRWGLAATLLSVGTLWFGVWAAVRLIHRRPLAGVLGRQNRMHPGSMLRGLAASLIVHLAIFLMTLATSNDVTRTDIHLADWLLLVPPFAAMILIQVSAEEVAFRGYLLQQLAARFDSPLVWAVAPSLLFAVLHWHTGATPWMSVAYIVAVGAFGLLAVLLVVRTGDLGAATGVHLGMNLMGLLLVSSDSTMNQLALYRGHQIDDPGLTAADALVMGLMELLAMAAVLALLLHPKSPIRLPRPGGQSGDAANR